MNSFLLQKCHFGNAIQDSPFKFQAYNCDGINYTLNTCMDEIKEPYGEQYYEENKVILLRSGMDPQDDGAMDQQICSTHRSILGKEFLRTTNRNHCHHVKHLGPRSNKAAKAPKVA